MHSFLAKFAAVIRGVLSGFDRVFFCGTLRRLSYPLSLQHYLWEYRILFKDFAAHSQEVTAQVEAASLKQARQLGREIRCLNSARESKEDIARVIDNSSEEIVPPPGQPRRRQVPGPMSPCHAQLAWVEENGKAN